MNRTEAYHRWVEWSEEDQVFIGRCPDLFAGGVHADSRAEAEQRLQFAIDDVADIYEAKNQWPAVRTRPVAEVA